MTHAGSALLDPHVIFEKIGLHEGMRIADFGCGRTGHFIFPAARTVGDTGIVYAVEILQDVLKTIQSRARSEGFHNVQTVWSNVELPKATGIPAGSLDAVCIVNMLSTLQKPQAALVEAARLLATTGRCVVVDWMQKLGTLGPALDRLVTAAQVETMAHAAGLAVVENFKISEYHYCLILEKK